MLFKRHIIDQPSISCFLIGFVMMLVSYSPGDAQDMTNKGLLSAGTNPVLYVQSITNKNIATLEVKGTLKIAGDFTNDGTFNTNSGTVEFTGTSIQNIRGTAANDQFYNLKMDNSGPGLKLNKSIMVTNELDMTDGDIDLNGNDIDLGNSGTVNNEANDKRIYGSSGTIIARDRNLDQNDQDYTNIAGLGIDISTQVTGNVPGLTTIARSHEPIQGDIQRIFDITPTENTALNISMDFYYFDNELTGAEYSFVMYRSIDGGITWADQGGNHSPLSNKISLNGFQSFSKWSGSRLGKPPSPESPLPVQLLDFSGKPEGAAVRLDWVTASETNNDYFTVERSVNGLNFNGVTDVNGAGNSNTTLYYRTYDENPLPGTSYYRLKQTDFDEGVEHSHIISVKFNSSVAITVFPNPFTGSYLNLSIDNIVKEEILVILNNALGETLYSKVVLIEQQKSFVTTIDLQNRLTPGLYVIIGTSRNEIFRQKLIVIE